jgi:hypothetical protein
MGRLLRLLGGRRFRQRRFRVIAGVENDGQPVAPSDDDGLGIGRVRVRTAGVAAAAC